MSSSPRLPWILTKVRSSVPPIVWSSSCLPASSLPADPELMPRRTLRGGAPSSSRQRQANAGCLALRHLDALLAGADRSLLGREAVHAHGDGFEEQAAVGARLEWSTVIHEGEEE